MEKSNRASHAAVATTYPLTSPQVGIWNTEKRYPGTSISVVAATLKLRGDIDFDLVEQAINLELERNDGYRLRFTETAGGAQQYVMPYQWYPVALKDFTKDSSESVYQWDNRLSREPFDLYNNELFQIMMFRTSENEGGVYIKTHHLLSDAWTLSMFGSHIIEIYQALKTGQPVLPETTPSYIDYINSEQAYLDSDRFRKDEEYWLEKFETFPEAISLKDSTDAGDDTHAHRKTYVLPHRLCLKIREHCAEYKTSPFALFLASLAIYINRVTGREDIAVGTPVLNRSNFREKGTVGMFISTVPLRIGLNDGTMDFRSFYTSLTKEWMANLRHQKYPYTRLLRQVRERHREAEALYDILLSYQNAQIHHEDDDLLEHEGRWHFNGHQLISLSIHINDRDGTGDLIVDYDYLEKRFFPKEIDFIHDHIMRILWHALDNPSREVSRIDMISEREKEKLLTDFNNTDAEWAKDETLHSLFRKQVALHPDRTAVTFGSDSLAYRDLDRWSDAIAARLMDSGAGPDSIIALLLQRGPGMVASMLGVLKAGAAYLPIDPDYPEDRIQYILEDSGSLLLLADESPNVSFTGPVLTPGTCPEERDPIPELRPDGAGPENLAYIIYTSGSTGMPKGVMIEHRNVVRLMMNDQFQFDFNENDVWTLFHSYCFDFSVWELYGALLYGGRLVVVPREAARDTHRFRQLLSSERVSVLNQTPAAFYQLIQADQAHSDRLDALRWVVFGGEALKPQLLRPFRRRNPHVRLVNMYGITETTVHVTFKELSDADLECGSSNIGKPIPTLKTYIMDPNLLLLPIGIPGELCVSGEGLARGYLNRPDLTDQKFVPHPYIPGEKLYRSGDLARRYAEGDLEYLGRIDNQVKIRGHRIELGEIESALLQQESVQEAVVITRETQTGTRQLCAYYVPTSPITLEELRTGLKRRLPDYMLPSYLIPLDAMPLTGNGKVDRKRLPEPTEHLETDTAYVPPETGLQRVLVENWALILEMDADRIGLDDDFFHLGGDSLSAIRVMARLDSGLTAADLYEYPTVRSLADFLEHRPATAGGALLRLLAGSYTDSDRVLVCFTYGGGSAYAFKPLADAVCQQDPRTVVYAVCFPGHEYGQEEPYLSIDELAERVSKEILSLFDCPVTLYGHCVGTAPAHETARLLEAAGRPALCLCTGAILPPLRPSRFGKAKNPWRHVSDRMILRILRRIGMPETGEADPDIFRFVLRAFRYDVAGFYRYYHALRQQKAPKMKTPVHILAGLRDPMTLGSKRRQRVWQQLAETQQRCTLPGAGHYFIRTHAETAARLLTEAVAAQSERQQG